MHYFKLITLFLYITCSLYAAEFTVSSYNCGGLSDHYDYLRAATMQKIMQERYNTESEKMALVEKIQSVALKILFAKSPEEQQKAQQEWNQKNYSSHFDALTSTPNSPQSPNTYWNRKVEKAITSYKMRPVTISDEEVNQMLNDHLRDLTKNPKAKPSEQLQEARAIMAQRIFTHQLKYDIICLQEADYLDSSMFPNTYEVLFSESSHSINGIAWNKKRFELVEYIGSILDRAFAVLLLDKETNQTVLVASGHLTGCNPFRIETDARGNIDSAKGDAELQAVVDLFEEQDADMMIIGMDSNVTSLHPRLNILKNGGYQLDPEHALEPTCTNPYQVLNTRIDWIAIKTNQKSAASITNIPVLNVGLNSMQTNISDHKPIAARIRS